MHGKSDWITLAYYAKSEASEKFLSLSPCFISIETFTNKATFPSIDVASLHKKELFYASLAKFQFDKRERELMYEAGHESHIALRH